MVSPASPVPVMVGVVSLVAKSSTVGAVVSMVTELVSELPLGSVTVTSRVSPSSRSVGKVPVVGVSAPVSTENVPSGSTVVSKVTSGMPSPSVSISAVMVSPGSPVPVMVGVVSLVVCSSIVGVTVSMVRTALSVLPPGSVTVMSRVSPLPRFVGKVPAVGASEPVSTEYVPSGSTMVSKVTSGMPSSSVSISTVIVSPGSPVPVMVGVVSLVVCSSIVGVTVSMVRTALSVFPAGSVTVMASVSPSARLVGKVPLVGNSVLGLIVHPPVGPAVVS